MAVPLIFIGTVYWQTANHLLIARYQKRKTHKELLEVVLVGDHCAGRNDLYVNHTEHTAESIKANFKFKILYFKKRWKKMIIIRLQIWNAEDLHSPFIRSFHSGTRGIMLIFDITNRKTFQRLDYWMQEIYKYSSDFEMVVVGNRCHLKNLRKVSVEEATKFAEQHRAVYIEISTDTGQNIEEAFVLLKGRMTMAIHSENKTPETPFGSKILDKNKEILLRNLHKAQKLHGTIPIRYLNIFVTGSGATGKTSFVNLLLQKKFNAIHDNTNVVHNSHAVSVRMSAGSSDNVSWMQYSSNFKMSLLRSTLISRESTEVPWIPVEEKDEASNTIQSEPSKTSDEQQYNSPAQQDDSLVEQVAGQLLKSDKDSMMLPFHSSTIPTIVHQTGEALNIINVLDTGGQPQYVHLLPTLDINPTVNFVVHDLSKNLDDEVLVECSQHGRHTFAPYHLRYSNLDMIKLLMSSANDALERSPSAIPHIVTNAGKNKRSHICLVGTHADKVSPEVGLKTADKLAATVGNAQCKASVWETAEGKVLFSVDNTTAGSLNSEDPVADVIRSRVESLSAEKEVYELPITWVLFELEIRDACAKQQKSYIPFDNCVSIAKEAGLISDVEEVRSALLHHHSLGVLLYFSEVPGLCNYVITDHQWWFDKLSSLVCVTFQQDSPTNQAVQKLKYEGLFSVDFLRHIEWKDDINQDFFLSLLAHKKIIAPVVKEKDEGVYFMPFVLPTFTLQQKDEILPGYGQLLGESLLFQFRSGVLPRGLFCSLVVELLQSLPNGWYPYFSHGGVHHTFSNLITFSLPDGYSLSLFDKVSYLEVQMRHIDNTSPTPTHGKASNHLASALKEVCAHLNFDYERLQYGFLCQCGKTNEDHIAVLPETTSSTMVYAECSIDNVFHMKVNSSQLKWFLYEEVAKTDSASANEIEMDLLAFKSTDQPDIKRSGMVLLREKVVPRIATDWNMVADYLGFEEEDKRLIGEKFHHDPIKCCEQLLEDWVSGDKGVSPKSWTKLIEVLRKSEGLVAVIEEIVEDLAMAGVSV
ncbi:uncharacterized protein [Dysidea avara]|uniref:uncharacterized protein isoform X2 n=1 Tax=Dysidea avara TaxID=196820 RepID=UPI00332A1A13